jgi:hypothetical protein
MQHLGGGEEVKVKALFVDVNGQHLVTLALGDTSILHAIVEIHCGLLNFIVRGQNPVTGENVRWPTPQLKLGDQVSIRVVEKEWP